MDERPNDSYDKVVEWLNTAQLSPDNEKLQLLQKATEIIVHKEPQLLNEFIDHMIAFQADRNAEVRKNILTFYELAGKKHHKYLPKILPNLLLLLNDPNLQVQKKVIQVSTTLYKEVVNWMAELSDTCNEDIVLEVWNAANSLKSNIINLVDNDHDGILNQTVKFMQTVIILQTNRDSDDKQNDVSIYDIPMTMKFTKRRKLEDEAMVVFDLLVKFHDSKHISSTSLMTCMTVLTAIALARSQFFGKVIAALETVHTHLPPDLSESQVSAVRKHLKCQLLSLLKHPVCVSYQQNIMTLLTDLGATYSEVMKILPKDDDRKRKHKKQLDSAQVKKPRQEEPPPPAPVTLSGLDLTETWINERLLPSVAAQIIMETLPNLPNKMPPLFSSAYTPIAAAGTPAQVKHVSRLLGTQIHAVGLGPGATQKTGQEEMISDHEEPKPKPTLPSPILKPILKIPRTLKLAEITKPLDNDLREEMAVDAVKRILHAEKGAANGGALRARMKIITSIATTFGLKVRQAILDYILADVRQRLNLAMAWLYEEYSILQGFYKLPEILQHDQKPDHNYNTLLCSLAVTVIEKPSDYKDRELLFARLYLEAPLITDSALDILKQVSAREVSAISLLQQLVLKRPAKQLLFLNTLLEQTSHHISEINKCAVKLVLDLYSHSELRNIIEEYATFYLGFLRLSSPPDVLFGLQKGSTETSEKWNESVIKCCLRLYLAILPHNEELIHELANVYASTDSDIKRIILRLIEIPVQKMGMSSPQLLKLVDEFPKGAETLVTRVLHIVTDKQLPSEELVNRVKELYQTRVPDVRFLIPVLNGLSKNEIFNAIPHLIKLNPNVVKEVFNRLLGGSEHSNSPISPSELLIALHKIDTAKCELKFIIKATSLCFADKTNFTQEVLAVVIQNLMDITPLPTLLMRTVIQAISFYPRLIGFGMNILQRLILKQVWKHRKVWEGFIKCCERTKPNSFQVLLQLPPEQLEDVFQESRELKPALLEHILSYTENQRSHIPQAIMDVIYGRKAPVFNDFSVKHEPMSPPELTIDIKEEPQDEPIPV